MNKSWRRTGRRSRGLTERRRPSYSLACDSTKNAYFPGSVWSARLRETVERRHQTGIENFQSEVTNYELKLLARDRNRKES